MTGRERHRILPFLGPAHLQGINGSPSPQNSHYPLTTTRFPTFKASKMAPGSEGELQGKESESLNPAGHLHTHSTLPPPLDTSQSKLSLSSSAQRCLLSPNLPPLNIKCWVWHSTSVQNMTSTGSPLLLSLSLGNLRGLLKVPRWKLAALKQGRE